MFELDRFKADCSAAVGETAAAQAVREIVALAVADHGAVQKALGEPRRAEVQILHRSADLTILNVVWGPRMTVMPHNHDMWAVIAFTRGVKTTSCGGGCPARQGTESRPLAPKH